MAETGELKWLQREAVHYPDQPSHETLDVFANPNPEQAYWVTFDCPEFTSLCPVTGQPDFGHITIHYIPDQHCIESKSLKLYLFSYRNHPAFHEAVVNRIIDDLTSVCAPKRIKIVGQFNPRGGISITVEANRGFEPDA